MFKVIIDTLEKNVKSEEIQVVNGMIDETAKDEEKSRLEKIRT